ILTSRASARDLPSRTAAIPVFRKERPMPLTHARGPCPVHASAPARLRWSCLLPLVGVVVLLATGGAGAWLAALPGPRGRPAETKPEQPKQAAEVKRKELGKNVFFETEGVRRRVVVVGSVVLRENTFPLEGLLTRRQTKDYEYIL